MKKLTVLSVLIAAFIFQFCSASKKAQKAKLTTYDVHVAPIITNSCSPCHIPPKGNKEALNSYAAAKEHADQMIERIQKNPGDKGFMPFKHPKLPDSTIQVFVKWKADGLLEN
ncbi:MAG: hypothetical protein ACXWCZ_07640 [Flavisolibacter sp.]